MVLFCNVYNFFIDFTAWRIPETFEYQIVAQTRFADPKANTEESGRTQYESWWRIDEQLG
jgi:hypothetical protein